MDEEEEEGSHESFEIDQVTCFYGEKEHVKEFRFWALSLSRTLIPAFHFTSNTFALCRDVVPRAVYDEAHRFNRTAASDLYGDQQKLEKALSDLLPTRADIGFPDHNLLFLNVPIKTELQSHATTLNFSLKVSWPHADLIPDVYDMQFKFLDGHPLFRWFNLNRYEQSPSQWRSGLNHVHYSLILLNGLDHVPPVPLDYRDKRNDPIFLKNGYLLWNAVPPPYIYYWRESKSGEICAKKVEDLAKAWADFITELRTPGLRGRALLEKDTVAEGLRWPQSYHGELRAVTEFVPGNRIATGEKSRLASVADVLLLNQGKSSSSSSTIYSIPEVVFLQYLDRCVQKEEVKKAAKGEAERKQTLLKEQGTLYHSAKESSRAQPERFHGSVPFRPKLLEGVEKYVCAETRTDLQAGYSLPVIRYPRLYYSKSSDDDAIRDVPYCGTFYFFQPDSQQYLNLGNKIGTFATKIHAMLAFLSDDAKEGNRIAKKLEKQQTDPTDPYSKVVTSVLLFVTGNLLAYNWDSNWRDSFPWVTNRKTQDDLQLAFYTDFLQKQTEARKTISIPPVTAIEADRLQLIPMTKTQKHDEIVKRPIVPLLFPSFDVVDGPLLWEKGLHDYLDQLLCLYGRELGYSCIILQREKGEFRATTEILDVRPYSAQYSYFLTDIPKIPFPYSKEVPTIWFGEFGFAESQQPLKHGVLVQADTCRNTRCIPPFIGKQAKHCIEVAEQWLTMLRDDLTKVEYVSLNTYGQRDTYQYGAPRYGLGFAQQTSKSARVEIHLFPFIKVKHEVYEKLPRIAATKLQALYMQEAHAGGLIDFNIVLHEFAHLAEDNNLKFLERAIRFEQVEIEFPYGTLWFDFAPFGRVEIERHVDGSPPWLTLVFNIPFRFPPRA